MNEQYLMKKIAVLFALLLVVSLAVFPAATIAGQTTNQEKAMDFMEKVLPSNIDTSKYTITLTMDSTLIDTHPPEGYKVEDLSYSLSSENSKLTLGFSIENGVIKWCNLYLLEGQAITSKPYTNMYDAVTDFLKAYQVYVGIDSSNLIQMLNNVDLTKNSTITKESIKLTIDSRIFGGDRLTNFKWENMVNGVAYTKLDITFYDTGLLYSVIDTRKLYTVGDTSVNISMEQAIDIAIEGLKSYSYEMPDGSIVTNFKVSKDDVFATLETTHFDYELRPYWDVRLFLDEVYPGGVFAISAFIWANTGEVIEYGNMVSGGIDYSDNTNSSDSEPSSPNHTLMAVAAIVIVAAVAVATMMFVTKKKHK